MKSLSTKLAERAYLETEQPCLNCCNEINIGRMCQAKEPFRSMRVPARAVGVNTFRWVRQWPIANVVDGAAVAIHPGSIDRQQAHEFSGNLF